MSGIAELLHQQGCEVQGSDISENANVKRLRDKGMSIHIGHDRDHITPDLSAVVVSSAIKPDNPEVAAARSLSIPVVRRADMLAELMRMKRAVAIGGTHGKTTTTSLVGAVLEAAQFDPTVVNGGIINQYGTNTRLGQGNWMVVESDESDGSFTRLPAAIVAVTNIDPEHLEHYGDFDALRAAFRQFVENIPFYGYAVVCTDHPECQALAADVQDRRIISYGTNPQAEVRALNIRPAPGGITFDVQINIPNICDHAETYTDLHLPMMGHHNVMNALVAVTIARMETVPETVVRRALSEFQGVKRRFTKTGEVGGITVIDDYGHHPVEIQAVLKAARQGLEETGGKIHAIMQPHRYTRLHDLFSEFCACFTEADSVLITDVYEAGEAPIEGADKQSLADGITRFGHKDAAALEGWDALPELIAARAQPGDFVIFLGAGDITKYAYALPEQLAVFGNHKVQIA